MTGAVSICILPSQSAVIHVQLEKIGGIEGLLIVEPSQVFFEDPRFDHIYWLSLHGEDGYAQIVLINPTGFIQKLRQGTWLQELR